MEIPQNIKEIDRYGGAPVGICNHRLFESKHIEFVKITSQRNIESNLEKSAKKKTINARTEDIFKNTVFFAIKANQPNYSFIPHHNFCLMQFCHHKVYCKRDGKGKNCWTAKYEGKYKALHETGGKEHFNYKQAYKCDCGNNHEIKMTV